MKIAVFVSGLFSLTLMIIGSLFKMQHWPGAGVMIVVGTSLFSSVFCLLYFIYRIVERKKAIDVVEGLFVSGSLSIISIGIMFKVQHWPGAGVMLTVGITVLAAVLIPFLLVKFILTKEKANGMLILYTVIGAAFLSMSLAINVSREVIWGYEISARAIQQNNDALGIALQNSDPELDLISNRALEAYVAVEDYKRHIITQTERLDENAMDEYYRIEYLTSTDNYDIPTHILVGDPGSPNEGEWSASALKEIIESYNVDLVSLMKGSEAKVQIEEVLALRNVTNSGFDRPWEVATFYYQPLISVINTLNSLQSSILIAQSIAMQDAKNQISESGSEVED